MTSETINANWTPVPILMYHAVEDATFAPPSTSTSMSRRGSSIARWRS